MKRKVQKAKVITRHEVTYPYAEVNAPLPSRYIVRADGVTVGCIEKMPNTATDTFPWQAFRAITGQGPVRRGALIQSVYSGEASAVALLLREVA